MTGSLVAPVTIGNATLYCGDCYDLLETFDTSNTLISDVPYGMKCNTDNTRFSGGNTLRGDGVKHKKIAGDDRPFDPSPFLAFNNVILFGANHYWNKLPPAGLLVWLKRNDNALNTFLSDAEVAFINKGNGIAAYREVMAGSKKAVEAGLDPYGPSAHPSQKPIGLMQWCIQRFNQDTSTVIDPFMGSGTTGVACAKLGRRFIGVEIDRDYFDIACERIRKAYEQPDMLAGVAS